MKIGQGTGAGLTHTRKFLFGWYDVGLASLSLSLSLFIQYTRAAGKHFERENAKSPQLLCQGLWLIIHHSEVRGVCYFANCFVFAT